MPAYASVQDVQARIPHAISAPEQAVCEALLADAGALIDAYRKAADTESKKIVSCRMVVRVIGSGMDSVPIGASQGSIGALGYSQSWTMSGGGAGELYLSKADRQLLGGGNAIGSYSPLEGLQ